MAASSSRSNVLVTFDVDGTMLAGGEANKLGTSAHKQSINRAVTEVYGIKAEVDCVPHAGSTDREIVRRMCEACGLSDAETWQGIDRVIEISCGLIGDLIEDDLAMLVLPGVRELLHELTDRRAYVGMVTGNFDKIGWMKMKKAGLGDYLAENLNQPSAFGSDCLDRSDILALAVERAEGQGFVKEMDDEGRCSNMFHVGDAIADMAAARHVNGRGVGVLTGAFSADELVGENPFVILENLADTPSVLKLLGLSTASHVSASPK
jgi:phosphoglycolate phosphatase